MPNSNVKIVPATKYSLLNIDVEYIRYLDKNEFTITNPNKYDTPTKRGKKPWRFFNLSIIKIRLSSINVAFFYAYAQLEYSGKYIVLFTYNKAKQFHINNNKIRRERFEQ